jgi:hypothetical protein
MAIFSETDLGKSTLTKNNGLFDNFGILSEFTFHFLTIFILLKIILSPFNVSLQLEISISQKKKIEKVLSLEVSSITLLRQLVSSGPPFQATPIFLLDKNKFCSVVSKLSNKRKMDRPKFDILLKYLSNDKQK